MEYVCRRMTGADIENVLAMNKDFREDFIEPEAAKKFLAGPQNWLFTAQSGERIIAFALGYELIRLGGGRMLYIHEVGVMEEYQRQGVGTRLMRELKTACRVQGIGKMFLTAYQCNRGANALYQKVGGEFCPESQGKDAVYWFRTQA